MLIRPANAADIPAIMEIERQASTATHWSVEQYRHLFATGADVPSRRLTWVVLSTALEEAPAKNSTASGEDKSAVLGFLVAQDLADEWEIENLVVTEVARRRGLGRRLVDELITRARAAGAQSAFLEVRESNQAARALYEGVGFVVKGRRKGYYASTPEDAVIYRLEFTA